jgi:hypothetical protein
VPVTTVTAVPIMTGAPLVEECSECEYRKAVRDVKLQLESARHDLVMAELEQLITLNRSQYTTFSELVRKHADAYCYAEDHLFGEDVADYLNKVAKNLFTVVEEVATQAAFTKAFSAGAVWCKGKEVVAVLGQPSVVKAKYAAPALRKWMAGVEKKGAIAYGAGVIKKELALFSNVPDPSMLERATPFIPGFGNGYQLGASIVQTPATNRGLANGHAAAFEMCTRRTSELVDQYLQLRQEKEEARRIHQRNIDAIHGESKLWEIPGCCVRRSDEKTGPVMRPLWQLFDCGSDADMPSLSDEDVLSLRGAVERK